MRKVAVEDTALLRENEITCPLLTLANIAIGNDDVAVLLIVPGDHDDIRESEGCMRSCLSALRKPVGWPS